MVVSIGAVLILLLCMFVAMVVHDEQDRFRALVRRAEAGMQPAAPRVKAPPISTVDAVTRAEAPPMAPRFPQAESEDAPVSRGPIGNPAAWFSQDDYPATARQKGEAGRVVVRLKIDGLGVPRSCGLVTSSGSSALDDVTCQIMLRRARFIPAYDADGKAIWSSWTSPGVRWSLDSTAA
jgi:protein TonB